MRTEGEVNAARSKIIEAMTEHDLSDRQVVLLSGMSTALQWVAGAGGTTLQRLLDGEELAAMRRPAEPTP